MILKSIGYTSPVYSGAIPAHSVARAVFCTAPGQEVVILMTVVKKSSQIPKGLFDTAQRRMKEVRTDE